MPMQIIDSDDNGKVLANSLFEMKSKEDFHGVYRALRDFNTRDVCSEFQGSVCLDYVWDWQAALVRYMVEKGYIAEERQTVGLLWIGSRRDPDWKTTLSICEFDD